MKEKPELNLTTKQFDALLNALEAKQKNRLIRGAKSIGAYLGRSESYIRKNLARVDGSPIRRDTDGSLFVFEHELINYFQISDFNSSYNKYE